MRKFTEKIDNGRYIFNRLRRGLKAVHLFGETWRIGKQKFIETPPHLRDIHPREKISHCVIYGPDDKEYHLYGENVSFVTNTDPVYFPEYDWGGFGTAGQGLNRHGNCAIESKVKIYILSHILDDPKNWHRVDSKETVKPGRRKVICTNGTITEVDFDGEWKPLKIPRYSSRDRNDPNRKPYSTSTVYPYMFRKEKKEEMTTFAEILQNAPRFVLRKLEQLKFLRERPDYHPEKSAFEHIRIVTERLITTKDPDLIMAGIFHDLGKLECVKENPKTGYPTSPGHDAWAADLVEKDKECREWIISFGANPDVVAEICKEHMRVKGIGEMRPAKQEAIRQSPIWPKLEIFTRADDMLKDFTI